MTRVGHSSRRGSGASAGTTWVTTARAPGVPHRRQMAVTAAAFDEEGYYRIGDAGKFADPDDPSKGLLFDGRIAEDFKLTNGT